MASICSGVLVYRPAPRASRPSSRAGIPSFALLPKPKPSHEPLTLRFSDAISRRLQNQQRLFTAFASNSNPSNGESVKNDADETAAPRGPPLATILAGLLVFLLVCWYTSFSDLLFCGCLVWLLRCLQSRTCKCSISVSDQSMEYLTTMQCGTFWCTQLFPLSLIKTPIKYLDIVIWDLPSSANNSHSWDYKSIIIGEFRSANYSRIALTYKIAFKSQESKFVLLAKK